MLRYTEPVKHWGIMLLSGFLASHLGPFAKAAVASDQTSLRPSQYVNMLFDSCRLRGESIRDLEGQNAYVRCQQKKARQDGLGLDVHMHLRPVNKQQRADLQAIFSPPQVNLDCWIINHDKDFGPEDLTQAAQDRLLMQRYFHPSLHAADDKLSLEFRLGPNTSLSCGLFNNRKKYQLKASWSGANNIQTTAYFTNSTSRISRDISGDERQLSIFHEGTGIELHLSRLSIEDILNHGYLAALPLAPVGLSLSPYVRVFAYHLGQEASQAILNTYHEQLASKTPMFLGDVVEFSWPALSWQGVGYFSHGFALNRSDESIYQASTALLSYVFQRYRDQPVELVLQLLSPDESSGLVNLELEIVQILRALDDYQGSSLRRALKALHLRTQINVPRELFMRMAMVLQDYQDLGQAFGPKYAQQWNKWEINAGDMINAWAINAFRWHNLVGHAYYYDWIRLFAGHGETVFLRAMAKHAQHDIHLDYEIQLERLYLAQQEHFDVPPWHELGFLQQFALVKLYQHCLDRTRPDLLPLLLQVANITKAEKDGDDKFD